MDYKDDIETVFQSATKKGLWDHNDVHEHVSHINCEISEAYSAFTKNRRSRQSSFDHATSDEERISFYKTDIKNTFEGELADTKISLLSLAGHLKISLNKESIMIGSDLVIERAIKKDNIFIIINRIHQLVSNIPNQYYSDCDKIPNVESKIILCLNAVERLASHCNVELNYFVKTGIWFNSTRNYKHKGE